MDITPNTCPAGCPGCYLPKQDYDITVENKYNRALLIFTKSCLIPSEFVLPGFESRTNYRRKVTMHTEFRNGKWHFGLMKNDEVLDIGNCAIQSNEVNRSVEVFKKYLPATAAFPLKYYVHSGNQIALVLKTKVKQDFRWANADFTKDIAEAGAEGLWIHYNASAGRRIYLKDKLDLLWGKPVSVDENGMHYGPLSFTQQIRGLAARTIDMALQFFNENKISDTIIDLYSGSGYGINAFVKAGYNCMGVELSGEAVRMAEKNNPGVLVLRGKCHQRIPQIEDFLSDKNVKQGKWNLYVNPPRTGLDNNLMKWICKSRPEKIAYLSCSPHTLARDLSLLLKYNYKVTALIPLDFFPHTRHVETLALISR